MERPEKTIAPAAAWMLSWLTALLIAPVAFSDEEPCLTQPDVTFIDGGAFKMGHDSTYPEEGVARRVFVDPFWMDTTEVTVAQFEAFVRATNYVTGAEKSVDPGSDPEINLKESPELSVLFQPGGAVFSPTTPRNGWWKWVPRASWQYPVGPTAPKAAGYHPVTQIAYSDAVAYAEWAGGRLPTEAEWEFAALAGRENTDFGASTPEGANVWQGIFPVINTKGDGFEGVAPVGCFEANAFGLYDMTGNVWEWTSDWYAPKQSTEVQNPNGVPAAQSFDPANPSQPSRVLKGGSYLCSENFCRRYRPSARHPQEVGLGTNHIGFRVVYDARPHKSRAHSPEF